MIVGELLVMGITFTGRIAAGEGRFNTASENVINTETKSIPVNKKGVYFAFRDQGACISLLNIKVSYTRLVTYSVTPRDRWDIKIMYLLFPFFKYRNYI